MWLGALKLDPSYGKDTWSKLKIGGTVKKWTGNPLAQPFTAPEVEAGIPRSLLTIITQPGRWTGLLYKTKLTLL